MTYMMIVILMMLSRDSWKVLAIRWLHPLVSLLRLGMKYYLIYLASLLLRLKFSSGATIIDSIV